MVSSQTGGFSRYMKGIGLFLIHFLISFSIMIVQMTHHIMRLILGGYIQFAVLLRKQVRLYNIFSGQIKNLCCKREQQMTWNADSPGVDPDIPEMLVYLIYDYRII